MTDTTLPLLDAGSTISAADLFITRQGADTVDKKITGTQLVDFVNPNVSRAVVIPSGRYLTPANFGGLTNSSMVLNRIYLVPVIVPRTTTFTDFGFSTVAVTAVSVKTGVYASNTSGLPTGTPISGTTQTLGPYTTATLTAQNSAFSSPVTLAAGLYFLAAMTDVSGTFSTCNNTGQPNVFGATDMSSGNGAAMYFAGPYASGLVDLTSASYTFAAGVGSFYLGLRVQ